jgi:hypothetical protein
MKRITILLFIAILTFVAVLYIKRPDLFGQAWLWAAGLGAPVIGLGKHLLENLKTWFRENIQKKI